MAGKNSITPGGYGYWGRSPHARVVADHTVDKVLAWNFDKIRTLGLPFAVWREASSTQENLLKCSCVKDTAKQADVPCQSCYGTGSIPGYFKFGTRNYWAASFDAGWTLANITLDKDNRPFRFKISDGQVYGEAVSALITVSNTGKLSTWESRVDGFTRDNGVNSAILVEFNPDNESSQLPLTFPVNFSDYAWYPISELNAHAPSSSIRFRVTLSRTSTAIKSPMFEIVRIRFDTMGDVRGEMDEPIIRAIPTWDRESENRTNYGTRIEMQGKAFWTMPLTFFDITMPKETWLARLADDVFIESRYGATIGTRFAVINFAYSDTMDGQFSRQQFDLRQVAGSPGSITGEYFYRVF